MKKVFEFELFKKEKAPVTETKQIDGEDVQVTKEVEQDVSKKFFIKYPGRNLRDEAQLYYSACVNKAIKSGVMSVAMLAKRYVDDNGIYSEKEKKEIEALQEKLAVLSEKRDKISQKKGKTKKSEEKELEEVNKEIAEVGERVVLLSQHEQEVYRNTAEYYAQTRTIMYWISFLSYNEDGTPFFGDKNSSLDERLDSYDDIDQGEDSFLKEVAKKFTFLVSFWSQNQEADQETFTLALDASNEPS